MIHWMRTLTAGTAACVVSMAILHGHRADAAELVRDINDGPAGVATGFGLQTADFPGFMMFTMGDAAHGEELWYTDYTTRGTRLFRDIFPGREGSFPGWYIEVGNVTVFTARDAAHGTELWRSDGTLPGTFMLADIGPGTRNYDGGYPQLVLDGVLYFAADDGVHGNELWRTDGTREGTHIVSDIVPGHDGSYPGNLAKSATHLFFTTGQSVWVSDGTAAGTHLFADGLPAGSFQAVGNHVYFAANDGVHGSELWRADADGSNYQMVANLNTTPVGSGQDQGSNPAPFLVRGDTLYFMAQVTAPLPNNGTANDCLLFRTNSAGGVTELANSHARCSPRKVISLPAGAMYSLEPTGAGDKDELWVTDGTPGGTMPLGIDGLVYSATQAYGHFKVAYGNNGEAYFFGREIIGANVRDRIWRTDGTRAGTRVFADLPDWSEQQEIAFYKGRVYFDSGAGNVTAGDELWSSDGTPGGTTLVKDIKLGSFLGSKITNLRVVDDRLLFFAETSTDRLEPWISDGTTPGTVNLGKPVDVTPGVTGDSNVTFAGELGGGVVIVADGGSGAEGRELNITDGTRIGTKLILDINNGGSSDPDDFLALGSQMLFVAHDFDHGRELWRTDGTGAGTIRLTTLTRDSYDSANVTLGESGTVINGIAYFTAGQSSTLPELWRTDGTVSGTTKVPGSHGRGINIVGGNGTSLLFTSYDPLAPVGVHLRSFDGTTSQIITPADALHVSADPGISFDGRVCFRASEAGSALLDVWCANGTAGDLVRATNLVALGQSAGDMHVLGNKLLVNALGSGAASGLYATTGMSASQQKVSAERIASAKAFGATQLVFATENDALRVTDGTSAGTRDLLPGAALPGPVSGAFGVLGSYVVFMVNDPQRGAVVWRTDGTTAGTRYLADLDPGTDIATSESNVFYAWGSRLLFTGYKTGIGNELWSLNATDPGASDDAAMATGGVATTVSVLDNDADFDGALNAASVTITTQPVHGTATVNATTGAITYTATSSYSGTDTVGYRVADDQGHVSNEGKLVFQVTAGVTPPPPATTPPSGGKGGGGGGALGLEMLGLLLLAIARLRASARGGRAPLAAELSIRPRDSIQYRPIGRTGWNSRIN